MYSFLVDRCHPDIVTYIYNIQWLCLCMPISSLMSLCLCVCVCVCFACSASPLIVNLHGESALDLAEKVKDRPALGDQKSVTLEVLQV
jgi:hypothetical protein